MIHDRGAKKWKMAMMLPEHKTMLSQLYKDQDKVEKPELDQQQLEEIEQTICEAMTFNQELTSTYYKNGKFELLVGKVHFLDEMNKTLHIQDHFGDFYRLKFHDIINVQFN
ncbi:YolD-like family protein [Bacillus taeanensis]|uniref:YolD-like family protein n=1 Tax=Bacillus taeanensis TaxID=273032 RepID=A0A366XU14_9BACI|nr:YolD-like family protein [Bacillus taeanensis]RBW68259.1 YolD-like family protein [Bacillus taeanensis]